MRPALSFEASLCCVRVQTFLGRAARDIKLERLHAEGQPARQSIFACQDVDGSFARRVGQRAKALPICQRAMPLIFDAAQTKEIV